MPSTLTICYYAMYVIGEVESNWSWTAVNYNDPITIGMMQWYGTRAAGLLNRMRNESASDYAKLSASLRSSVESYDQNNRAYWESRYLTQEEGNSVVEAFSSQGSHSIQENQAIADFQGYISTLESWGMSQERPKPLIFAMAMYHQNPSICGRVMETAGGNCTLERVYQVCLNNGVFGGYRTRYSTVYDRLVAWDGESDPPDFGQNGSTSEGGDSGGSSTISSSMRYVIQSGDNLVIWGTGAFENGLVCYPAGGQIWRPAGTTRTNDIASQVTYIQQIGDILIIYGTKSYAGGVQTYPASGQRWTCKYNADVVDITGGNEGGGDETGNEAQQDIVALYTSWIGQFDYGQGAGRLTPTTSGYGDCSSTIWFAYQQITSMDIGTWTGAMEGTGTLIMEGSGGNLPLDQMQLADIILYWWSAGTSDHVELYIGGNRTCGHGGPGKGPTIKEDAQAYAARAIKWQVKRYL